MAMEDFERLRIGRPDSRKAYRVEETPDELVTLIAAGLDRIVDGTDCGG
jgi:hypothetical protein